MPRVYLTEIDENKAKILNAIKAAGATRDKTPKEMALIGGMSLTAYYNKINGKHDFTVTEILRYTQKLGIKFDYKFEVGL